MNEQWQTYLNRFITYMVAERNASPYTVRNYRHEVAEFLEFLESEDVHRLQEIDRPVARRYVVWLSEREYGRASIARRLSEVRSFFEFLKREKITRVNPVATIPGPKVPQRLPNYL
jgi:integrase/recombinase XerC